MVVGYSHRISTAWFSNISQLRQLLLLHPYLVSVVKKTFFLVRKRRSLPSLLSSPYRSLLTKNSDPTPSSMCCLKNGNLALYYSTSCRVSIMRPHNESIARRFHCADFLEYDSRGPCCHQTNGNLVFMTSTSLLQLNPKTGKVDRVVPLDHEIVTNLRNVGSAALTLDQDNNILLPLWAGSVVFVVSQDGNLVRTFGRMLLESEIEKTYHKIHALTLPEHIQSDEMRGARLKPMPIGFSMPYRCAEWVGGKVITTDQINRRLVVYSNKGEFLQHVLCTEVNSACAALAIESDREGQIFLTSTVSECIFILAPPGELVARIRLPPFSTRVGHHAQLCMNDDGDLFVLFGNELGVI